MAGRLRLPALALLAGLAAACAARPERDQASAPPDGAPVVRGGMAYAPAGTGPEGCVLYGVRIPGGQAPAALVYRDAEGRFTYERPAACVKDAGAP